MRVVKVKKTGRIIYREEPDFEVDKGIINTSTINKMDKLLLEEVEINQTEWDSHIIKLNKIDIKKETDKQSAIIKLKKSGLTKEEINALIG